MVKRMMANDDEERTKNTEAKVDGSKALIEADKPLRSKTKLNRKTLAVSGQQKG